MRRRDLAVAVGVAVLVAGLTQMIFAPRIAGTSIDLLFWLRQTFLPLTVDPQQASVVVVALDEESQHRPPFSELPHVMWTPQIAKVLTALVDAGATSVGFDAIFPTSGDQISPGFDHDFLLALRHAAQQHRVILGEAQQQRFPTHPFAAQIFAVGGAANIRALNAIADEDSVVRRLPLTLNRVTPGGAVVPEPTLALELAARAAGALPAKQPDGRVTFAGHELPEAASNAVLLNFAGPDAIPTYSLADLYACAMQGNGQFFRDHFAGKTILLGAVLDVEDRELTSARLITGPEHPALGQRCVFPPMSELFRKDLVRNTIPGVLVLATAVDNLIAGNSLRLLGVGPSWAVVLLAALGSAAAAQLLAPSRAAMVLGLFAFLWAGVAIAAFRQGLVIPLFTPPLAAGLTLAVLLGYRFAVSDRDRRLLRSTFGLYLAPALVDRMMATERLPELGGEMRQVTVLFSDVAGFSQLSEALTPSALVELMNSYLTAMTDIIEEAGGYVDKYIGDAIVAMFGAPVEEPSHAARAVGAALACRERLTMMNAGEPAFAGHKLGMRIGLNTGEALVGNIGSRRRFNYTAMGDTVNLASRLEGANKFYGTVILASESVRQAVGDEYVWREVDLVRVVGRDQPVRLFAPQANTPASPDAEALRARFSEALATYRAGQFNQALALFDAMADRDAIAAAFAERLRGWIANGPPQPWDGITNLESK
jgi:class 3 adenylate cyclase/CHASE2 domain-containing sensor protein